MQDFVLTTDSVEHQLHLYNYYDSTSSTLNYTALDSTIMHIQGEIDGVPIRAQLHKIPLEKLPALQPSFHWTIDDYSKQ